MPLVDRQTLLFFIIMFIFLSLPGGIDQPHSNKDRETLQTFQASLKDSRHELHQSEYNAGYGNITGFKLSYQDNLDNKNASQWPLHNYNKEHPWMESEEYSILPNEVSDTVKKFWSLDSVDTSKDDSRAYLFNISGKVHGEFETIRPKTPLKKYGLEIPKYLRDHYELYTQAQYEEEREKYEQDPENHTPPTPPSDEPLDIIGNLTFSNGRISLGIRSLDYNFKDPDLSEFIYNSTLDSVDDAVVVKMKVNLIDYPEIDDNELETVGIYFQNTGALVSTTKSGKFYGSYGIPHLTIHPENFHKSKLLMGQLLNTTNIDKEVDMDDMNNSIQRAQTQCEYITYFQFEKTAYSAGQLRDIDEELMNPTGKPIPKNIPTLKIKESLLYSPDCGLILRSKPDAVFEGNKSEVTNNQLKRMLSGLFVLAIMQLFLLIKQLKELRTPGQLSNVSSVSIGIISFQDALMALLFLLISNLIEDLYLILACVAVTAFLMCGVFGLRFLVSVMTVQSNESGTTWWEILRGSRSRDSENQGLPLPVTAGGPGATAGAVPTPTPNNAQTTATTTNVTVPLENDEAMFSNRVFGTGCILTIISTFIILNSLLWRIKFRRVFEYVGLIAVNSYWLPQFSRNTLKNRRWSFSWDFILGTSIIRVLPVWYLCLNRANPLRHHYDPALVGVLSGWLACQVLLLYLQQIWGPRFWVNENWLPKAYDYHYLLNIKDLQKGGGFSSDMLASITAVNSGRGIDQEGVSGGDGIVNCKVDCAICMNDVDLPVNTNADGKNIHQLDKSVLKQYMITPCHHIFHTTCLEDWMVYKLQCPVCRTGLPPV